MKLMTETEYALYKGDKFIDLGTIDYLAKKYNKKKETLKYLSYPSAHDSSQKNIGRIASRDGNGRTQGGVTMKLSAHEEIEKEHENEN